MQRATLLLLWGMAVGFIGLLSVEAQEATKPEKHQIAGGIEGHIKSVDADKGTLTIMTTDGRERTFSVNHDTMMLGPRGGKVRYRLHDKRFHEGMNLTIVAAGTTAEEVHLGYNRRETGEAHEGTKKTTKAPSKPVATDADSATPKSVARKRASAPKDSSAQPKPAASDEDEDDEIPATVKSYNTDRRLLVVSLLNGTNRSFFLSRDLKVLVNGVASKQGTADAAIKEGAHVTVLLEEGSRRVKELHVVAAPHVRRLRKAS
jgi:hypothetical protein